MPGKGSWGWVDGFVNANDIYYQVGIIKKAR